MAKSQLRRDQTSTGSPAETFDPQPPAGFQSRWLLLALGTLLAIVVMALVAGDQSPAVFRTFIYAIFLVPLFIPAWMLGILLTAPFAKTHLFDASPAPGAFRSLVAIALGLGAFSLATLAMGTLHLIEPSGATWPVLIIPLLAAAIGLIPVRNFLQSLDRASLSAKAHRGSWLYLLAAVPIAMLLISATFPPGTLWAATEAHGYDVLEYHLQLPREYALNNSTAPVPHNVYSYFPSNVEMLYLFLMQTAKLAMVGGVDDPSTGYVWGAFPAQFCHAFLLLLSALALALIPLGKKNQAVSYLHATGRAIAVALFLGIPWSLITGSLAYNEAGMLYFGSLAIGLALADSPNFKRSGVLVGLLLGLAVGCKMTAGVFFALPVAAILLRNSLPQPSRFRSLLLVALIALATYSPWALRAAFYSGGNPVFPLASNILPRNDWSPEQSDRFNRGHAAPAGVSPLRELAKATLFDGQWSVQPYALLHITDDSPPRLDTWWKSLGLLWIAIPLALTACFLPAGGRSINLTLLVILFIQLVAWLFATHLQSRFLLPIAIPLSLLVGRGVQGLQLSQGIPMSAVRVAAGTLVALHALFTVFLLLPEAHLFGGVIHSAKSNPATAAPSPIGELFFPPFMNVTEFVEHPDAPQFGDQARFSKVLLVADATAWRFAGPVQYATVFDHNLFLEQLRANNPQKTLAWLQSRQIRYIWIDWREVARFRSTYGFDDALTPVAIADLAIAGISDTHAAESPIQILRVPEPSK